MRQALVTVWLAAGCSFTRGSLAAEQADGAIGDVPLPSCVIGSIDLCAQAPPDAPVVLGGTLDTDLDPRCRVFAQPGGGPSCLIWATALVVGGLEAVGSRPLLLVSEAGIAIDGILDVSSYRGGRTGAGADHASCAVMRVAEPDTGGASGGAGGSFQGKGGDGGEGDTDDSLGMDGTSAPGLASAPVARPAFARGGCPGGRGADEGNGGRGGTGGDSGGAVWLAARETIAIAMAGGIRATGAGGAAGEVQSGGGGGGSGGMIVIEATSIDLVGPLSANGGGGGEGGTRVSGTPVTGNPGSDGMLASAAAPGGSGAQGTPGDGGAGSAGSALDGGAGGAAVVGGGGGGGGAGFIHLVGAVQGGTVVTPPPS